MNIVYKNTRHNDIILNLEHVKHYCSIFDILFHIVIKTCPDLFVGASALGAHVERHSCVNMIVIEQTLRYLKGPDDRNTKLKPLFRNQMKAIVELNRAL